ncbi:uncharacterized protein LOC110109509 [Dendrobium catenatum]|uniref:C2H2-type domain-containing protein n=1 Tax=Dendrobium catenatum TaxID=906689 RepID=A0A2I0VH37_9ASPA|nr:uncharacterized protein LOC110109509 [Dendrobium catenatum]PKU62732.1 hypothetical protein MA16_Dca026922 [Dendrobium catenatum]
MGSVVLSKQRSKKEEKGKDKMPRVWVSLKRSLHCKPEPGEVLDPEARGHVGSILNRRLSRSGCSRSIANLKDVIHGSKRHLERPQSCSPRSIGSSEFLNPITHEVILSNSKCELRITGFNGCYEGDTEGMSSTFVGTLRPGTPGPLGHLRGVGTLTPPRRSPTVLVGKREGNGFGGSSLAGSIGGNNGTEIGFHGVSTPRTSVEYASFRLACHKCGEKLLKFDDLEAHHLSKHAVTELVEGDSSRKIVEIICRTSLLKSETHCDRIDRIFKVHNTQKTLARFEEHREMIKNKVSKLPKKHPRCLADGNELLRFHGTTIACNLGINGSSSLCVSEKCRVCDIIRHGFSAKELKGGFGVFTTSTSARAIDSIELYHNDCSIKKALLVCRVIAGRVHRPLDNFQEISGQSGFDSFAGKVGLYSNIEELYLLNPQALLPCFVVIFKA